jgi:UPF0716 family protein affecting phage T7 exclusion
MVHWHVRCEELSGTQVATEQGVGVLLSTDDSECGGSSNSKLAIIIGATVGGVFLLLIPAGIVVFIVMCVFSPPFRYLDDELLPTDDRRKKQISIRQLFSLHADL